MTAEPTRDGKKVPVTERAATGSCRTCGGGIWSPDYGGDVDDFHADDNTAAWPDCKREAPWPVGDWLTPIGLVTQTITYSPEREAEGIYGNCLQAAVASLFSKPLDAVPHFSAFLWWNEALSLWAKGEGYLTEGERTDTVPDRLCIVGGKSPRGVPHVCVAENGHLVWDPHPDRSGLLTITDATWFVEHEPYMKWTRWSATQRRDESAEVDAEATHSGSTHSQEDPK